jgi:hypothetical protein
MNHLDPDDTSVDPEESILGQTVVARSVSASNDVGGTISLADGAYTVKVVKEWFDYECGLRYHGILQDPEAVEQSRVKGLTPYGPKAEDWDPSGSISASSPLSPRPRGRDGTSEDRTRGGRRGCR